MKHEKKSFCPLWVKITVLVFLVSVIIYMIAGRYAAVADGVNGSVSAVIRMVSSYVTYLLPFSLFELLVILALPLAVLLFVRLLRSGADLRGRVRTLMSFVGMLLIVAILYIYMLGVGYYTIPVSQKLDIEDSAEIAPEDLYMTIVTVRDEINTLEAGLHQEGGESIMPYDLDELSGKIVEAYSSFADEYGILTNFTSRAKPVVFSTVMSDLRITGIYSFFTGESNINIEYPDYNLPFTVAHEFAHQRGICRENEANFVAFLVCISSEDEFVRYSGYLSLFEYLASPMYRTDAGLYREIYAGLCDAAKNDMMASDAVYRAHEDSFLGEWHNRVNDTYLKLNGTEGTVSYGYVVRLAVGYYKKESMT